jgi:hypothetical protein
MLAVPSRRGTDLAGQLVRGRLARHNPHRVKRLEPLGERFGNRAVCVQIIKLNSFDAEIREMCGKSPAPIVRSIIRDHRQPNHAFPFRLDTSIIFSTF